MGAKPDWVRDVMFPAIRYCALAGFAAGGLIGYGSEPCKLWSGWWDLGLCLAAIGAFLAWFVTGVIGLVRCCFLGYE